MTPPRTPKPPRTPEPRRSLEPRTIQPRSAKARSSRSRTPRTPQPPTPQPPTPKANETSPLRTSLPAASRSRKPHARTSASGGQVGASRRGTPPPWQSRRTSDGADTGRTSRTPTPSAASRELAAHFRRRRRIAAAALAAVLTVGGVWLGGRALLYDAGLADVEGVEVTGIRTVPEPEVRAAAAVTSGVPLAGVDLAAIERRVERIPGVADADAGRSWPHTVTVTVAERIPVAVADTPQGAYLVDRTGVVYQPAPDPAALPKLAVPTVGPDDPATRAALDVLAALAGDLRRDVLAIEVAPSPTGQVTLRLTKNRQVRWGSPDRGAEKAAVLGPLLSQSGSVYDVVSPELPTVRR